MPFETALPNLAHAAPGAVAGVNSLRTPNSVRRILSVEDSGNRAGSPAEPACRLPGQQRPAAAWRRSAAGWRWSVWGEQQGVVLVGGGVVGDGDDLAVVVDAMGVVDLVGGAGRDQVVEVLPCPAAVDLVVADDHAAVVDRRREEVVTQVGHRAAAPQEAVLGVAAGHGVAGDLVEVVERGRGDLRASEIGFM